MLKSMPQGRLIQIGRAKPKHSLHPFMLTVEPQSFPHVREGEYEIQKSLLLLRQKVLLRLMLLYWLRSAACCSYSIYTLSAYRCTAPADKTGTTFT